MVDGQFQERERYYANSSRVEFDKSHLKNENDSTLFSNF